MAKSETTMQPITGNYRLVLGLEIHLHLTTKTKCFCGCSADIYDSEPNTHTCPTCLGLPGALPVPNFEAVRKTHLLGLALNSTILDSSKFDRKHYFYPDLPKGYQISQYQEPLCSGGYLEMDSGTRIELERVHLEEDTAKSFHEGDMTLIDFNKSGIPLVEIVTKPDFDTVNDAVEFSKKIQDIVRHLGIGNVDMEKGQMRLEANISLRTVDMEKKGVLPDYKVEIKNINSFKYMDKAVRFEIERQAEILDSGGELSQENRGWDENKNETVLQRSKEFAEDYRYFPEPDIPPMEFDEAYMEELREELPELPDEIKARLIKQYGISDRNARYFSQGEGLGLLDNFESIVALNVDPERAANLLKNKLEYRELSPEEFIKRIESESEVIEDEDALSSAVEKAVREHQSAVEDYKSGKTGAIEFLLGQVMRETQGKAEPNTVRELLRKSLDS